MKYFLLIFSLIFTALPTLADEAEPVHYAYANYLGSGIYRTTGQNASLISILFSYDFDGVGKTTYGLRLPVSVGFLTLIYRI